MLQVFLAHSGRTLELECSRTTRVEEVQETLAALTGTPLTDQILTCEGALLSPGSLVADFGLDAPASGGGNKARDVFLYSKTLLRADGPTPEPETLPELPPPSDGAEQAREPHPLDVAASPLLRALPEYHRQFQNHLWQAETAAAAGAARVALCCRLVNEAEVQAMAVDSAMACVEPHYAFICHAQAAFQERFAQRYGVHQDVLTTFESDVEFLRSVELPPQLCVGRVARLSDLVDLQELQRVAEECARSHRRFTARVSELEALHSALRTDVEALFMRAPSVDLDGLAQGLAAAAGQADEQATVAQALEADARRSRAELDAAAAVAPAAPSGLQDSVAMLESIHESHVTAALPRVVECGADIEEFARRCVAAKNALAADALRALRTIAAQQSKIREMKEALAPFPAALDRQDSQIGRLLVVRRLPAAYKQSLAECARRAAFGEKYAVFAADLAERMGQFRLKEAAMRDKFRSHVSGLMPADLLTAMGLDQPPPHCHVSVPGDEAAALLPVAPEDLRRLQLPRHGALADSSPPSHHAAAAATPSGSVPHSSTSAPGAKQAGHLVAAGAGSSAATATTSTAAAPPLGAQSQPETRSETATTNSLQMQNAQLRAELASQVALDCIRAAEVAAMGWAPQQQSTGATGVTPATGTSPAGGSSAAASGSAGAASGGPAAVSADAALKFERALAAKDSLVAAVKEEANRTAATLRERIAALEAQLAAPPEQLLSPRPELAPVRERIASFEAQMGASPLLLGISPQQLGITEPVRAKETAAGEGRSLAFSAEAMAAQTQDIVEKEAALPAVADVPAAAMEGRAPGEETPTEEVAAAEPADAVPAEAPLADEGKPVIAENEVEVEEEEDDNEEEDESELSEDSLQFAPTDVAGEVETAAVEEKDVSLADSLVSVVNAPAGGQQPLVFKDAAAAAVSEQQASPQDDDNEEEEETTPEADV